MTDSNTNYNILVVEDTIEFAQLTMMTLGRYGFSTAHAPDGETAVEMISHNRPNMVLLDLNLPGMTGWQVMEQLDIIYGKNAIPVVVTTAYSDSANRVVGKLQGVYRYLVKPFTPEDLLKAVEGALGIEKS